MVYEMTLLLNAWFWGQARRIILKAMEPGKYLALKEVIRRHIS
jgi:hypothetical protein